MVICYYLDLNVQHYLRALMSKRREIMARQKNKLRSRGKLAFRFLHSISMGLEQKFIVVAMLLVLKCEC